MVESTNLSSKYTNTILKDKLHGYDGRRMIFFVLINESNQTLTFVEQYNYHGKMISSINGTKIPPGGVAEWSACKQDFALYGTEIYTLFQNGSGQYIFIGVECPLGALPNAHTLKCV